MKKIVIKRGAPTAPVPSQSVMYQQYAPMPKRNENGGLCFFLGLLFGPFGILLSAIVSGAYGLKKSLLGFFLVGIPLTGLVWWLIFGRNIQKADAEAKKDACIANMEQIAYACEMCVRSGKEPIPSNIYGPDGYIRKELTCPLGGTYAIKRLHESVDVVSPLGGNFGVVCPHADKGHVLWIIDPKTGKLLK